MAGDVTGTSAASVVESATGAGGVFNIRTGAVLTFGAPATAASAGTVRAQNNQGWRNRNAANTADLRAFIIDATDTLTLGNSVGNTKLDGLTWALQVAGTTTLSSSATQVLSAQPIAIGAIPSTVGTALRLSSLGDIYARNAANTNNLRLALFDASDNITLGNSTSTMTVDGLTWALQVAGTTKLSASATLTTSANDLAFTGAAAASTTGAIRFANSNAAIKFRATTANDINIIAGTSGANTIDIGQDTIITNILTRTASTMQWFINTTERMRMAAGGISVGAGTGQYAGAVGAIALHNATTATTGNPTNAVTLTSINGIFTIRGSAASCISFENPSTATTVGATGAAAALPAQPLGYMIYKLSGTDVKVPYYTN